MSRQIRKEEKPLVTAIFAAAGIEYSNYLRVENMDDGGMGGLLFQRGSSISQFAIAEIFFHDEDGVLASAKLNATAESKPVELEFWKADSSPLKRWPTKSDILDSPPADTRRRAR